MKKEDLDVDPQSMDNRRLGAIARNPNHPMHTHAKAELDRRKMAKEEKDPEEYDNEGSMMKSQLRQICSANEKLMSMVKDDDNLPEWVQSKVTKATDYIRSVRDYLESEKMEEKTLTPAELKKREKIAKAIERDNPDMPMDKKMAIATATAKRVAEGKVDEISSNKLGDYMRKSAADVSKSRGDVRRQDKRIGGQKMADDKIRKKMGYSSQAKVPAGTNEGKVDEISIDKLSRYGKAAAKDIEQKRNKVKAALDQPASVKHAKAGMKAMQGLTKRSRGSDMYVDKMTGRSKVKPSASTVGKDKQVTKEQTTLARIRKILDR